MSLAHREAFTKGGQVVDLLSWIYEIELYGEAMYALMLEHGGPLTAQQRRKVEACRLLEIQMTELLGTHLVLELGVSLNISLNRAHSRLERTIIHGKSWQSRMAALEAAAAGMVGPLRELKILYAERQPMLCNTLLAHALMIRDFAHAEAEGDVDGSLGRIVSLLDEGAREALLQYQV